MGEGPGSTRPGKELPHGRGLGAFAAASVALGSWKQEEDRAAKSGPDPGSRRARPALDKGVFILATNKATVAGDFHFELDLAATTVTCRKQPLPTNPF